MINLRKVKDRFYSQDRYTGFSCGKKVIKQFIKDMSSKVRYLQWVCKRTWQSALVIKSCFTASFYCSTGGVLRHVYPPDGFLLVWTFNSLWENGIADTRRHTWFYQYDSFSILFIYFSLGDSLKHISFLKNFY